MSDITIRLATPADLPAINDIYNHYVLTCTCTYQETPETLEDRHTWFAHHDSNYPVTVAEVQGAVVAWASLSPFHPRSAFRRTVENSIYVNESMQGRGIGRALLADQIERATALGHKTIIACIDSLQKGSLILHERHGFVLMGQLKDVGFKHNKWLDLIYMQRML